MLTVCMNKLSWCTGVEAIHLVILIACYYYFCCLGYLIFSSSQTGPDMSNFYDG